jgi:uncharacterized protein
VIRSMRSCKLPGKYQILKHHRKYVNGNYAIRRTASGLGLIASKEIPREKRLIEYFGPRISNEEVEKSLGKYFFGVNSKWSVDGSPRTNIARYINHSCRPNAEARISTRGRIWIWSIKRIKPGEEIAYDYGKEYFENVIKPMGCRCQNCTVGENHAKRKTKRS